MKIKKILMAFLVLSATLLLVACAQTHTHTFAEEWSKDAENHWHAATCEHADQVSDKAAHDWDEGVITTEPTLDAEGVKTFTCTVCEQTKTEAVAKLEPENPTDTPEHEHTFSDAWTFDENEHWHAATCEHNTEVSGKAAHDWDEGVETTAPTADAEGVKTYSCTICEATKTESIAKLPKLVTVYFQNNWLWSDVKIYLWSGSDEDKVELTAWPGTAMELVGSYDNQKLYAFEFDANVYSSFVITGIKNDGSGALDQTPDMAVADHLAYLATDCFYMLWDSENSCNTYGHCFMSEDVLHIHEYATEWSKDETNHWHACSCGLKQDEGAHTWDEGVETTAPTADAQGVKTYTCTVCEATRTESIPALGHTHNHSTEWSKDETNHWHACSCGDKADEAAHTWDEGVETTAPTADAEGVKTYTCTVCEGTKTEPIAKLPKLVTIYFQNNWNWSDLYIYLWSDSNELAAYPGTAMELVGSYDNQELYAFEFDVNAYSSFIVSGINAGWEAPNNRDKTPDMTVADHLAYLATDCFYMNWDNGNVVGHCVMTEDKLHIHEYSEEWTTDETNHWHACSCGLKQDEGAHSAAEWSKDETNHWHVCACGYKYDEAAHAVAETKYENGYKVEVCACGNELSKAVHLTYVVSNTNDKSKNVVGQIELSEGVYSSTLTLAAWDFVVLYYDGSAISSSSVTMLPGTAWEGGAWAGVVYPLYHDGDATGVESTTGFVSPTGGEYKFTYSVSENTLLLGEYVEPNPENVFAISTTNADAGGEKAAVFSTAGDVLRATDGSYPHHPGTWDPYRLFIAVDSEGRIAFMCLMPIKGYGNPYEGSYARHSAYADYKTNPAFANLSDEYQGNWGTTVDWSLVVPDGGFIISAHGSAATAIGQYILNNSGFVATDGYENMVNSKNISVDDVTLVYDAEAGTVTVNRTAE